MSERCIWPLLNGPCPNDAWSAGLCREHSCTNPGVVLKRLQSKLVAERELAQSIVSQKEAIAADLERALDRERTGRLCAEERVRKLEAAVTKAYWDLADGDGFAMDILKRAHPRVDEGEEEASAGGES